MKKNLKFILIMIICLALCLCTACKKDENSVASKIKNASPVKVEPVVDSAPVEETAPARAEAGTMDIVQKNAISINSCELEGVSGDTPFFYVSISGLKDTTIQDAINLKLHTIAQELYAKVSSAERPVVGMSVEFNDNDVLSVCAHGYYNDPVQYNFAMQSVGDLSPTPLVTAEEGEIATYSVDLRTGKELTLGDLFTEGFDYKSIIGDLVDESIPFWISQYGLVFPINGENTYFGFDSFEDNWIIAGGCDSSIYEDPSLISPAMTYQHGMNNVVNENDNSLGMDNIFLYRYTSWPEGTPDVIANKINELIDARYPNEDEVLALAKANRGTWISGNFNAYCYAIGGYYSVHEYTNHDITDGLIWVAGNTYHTYDEDGRELGYSDVFTDSFDYETLIKEKLKFTWDMSYGASSGIYFLADDSTGLLSEELSDEIFNGITFAVSTDQLSFATKALYIKDLSGETENIYYTPLIFDITYNEIGANNLKIF